MAKLNEDDITWPFVSYWQYYTFSPDATLIHRYSLLIVPGRKLMEEIAMGVIQKEWRIVKVR